MDYQRLNRVTQEDRYPMPRVEKLLEQLGSASFIMTLDLTKGYYQVSVHPDDREKTAFMCPMGKFQDAIQVEAAIYGYGVGLMCKVCSSIHRRYRSLQLKSQEFR